MASTPEALRAAGWIEQPDGNWYFPGTGVTVDPTGSTRVDSTSTTTTTSGGTTSGGTTSGGVTHAEGGSVEATRQALLELFSQYGADPYTHADGTPRDFERLVVDVYSGDRALDDVNQAVANYTGQTPTSGGGSGGGGVENQMGAEPGTFSWTGSLDDVMTMLQADGGWNQINSKGEYHNGVETLEQAANRIYSQLISGTRSIENVQYWLGAADQSAPDTSQPVGVGGGGDSSPGQSTGKEGLPGVWDGGNLVLIQRPGADDVWAMVYNYQGKQVSWEFDSYEQLEATIGGPGFVGGFTTMSDANYRNNVIFAGQITEVMGAGSFQTWVNDTIRQVGAEAGIGDPTLWGQYMADPAVQDILFRAAVGEWSENQVLAEVRKTDFYQNTLFPGIKRFYNSDDPEQEWYRYFANVKPVLEGLGVDLGTDGGRNLVGQMIQANVSDETFISMSGVFQRAKTSTEYAQTLDHWMQQELGQGLNFNTWFDVLAGQAEADVRDVVNKAVLAYQSGQTGANITDQQISRIAERRPGLTDLDSASILEEFMGSMQAVREVVGERYGITTDELLSVAAGIEAPSGRSLEEIQRLTRQAAGELGRLDDQKLQVFLDFSPLGTPRRPGLTALAPEGG